MKPATFCRWLAVFIVAFNITFHLTPYPSPPHLAHSQRPAPSIIESDAPPVTPSGRWTAQSAPFASGGRYLYSSGDASDVLTLPFAGPSLEVLYVAGPRLGTLVIEIDDTVLRTVITRADQTAYQQAATIHYLSDENHTLRVYAQGEGIIAVDAFVAAPPVVMVDPVPVTNANPRLPCHPNALMDALPTPIIQRAAITADGRYVLYAAGQAPATIYEYDRLTCATTPLVTLPANGLPISIKVSADRLHVTVTIDDDFYMSGCSANRTTYWIDRRGASPLVTAFLTPSVLTTCIVGDLTADGRYFAYTNSFAIYVYDLFTGTSTALTYHGSPIAVSSAYDPPLVFSADGRYVFFRTYTAYLPTDTNSRVDVYAYDRQTADLTIGSLATGGGLLNGDSAIIDVSADGRFVFFMSYATNAVPNDTNGQGDLFVHDRQTLATVRVNVATDGTQANTPPFVYLSTAAQIGRPPPPFNYGTIGSMTGDGRLVVFSSAASTLTANDTIIIRDIFMHDLQTHATTLISAASGQSSPSSGDSAAPAIADNGSAVVFNSSATDLVPGVSGGFFIVPTTTPGDHLALFVDTGGLALYANLLDTPYSDNYLGYGLTPPASGQGVMGDWDGDGIDTPGVYAPNGVFYYLNSLAGTPTWYAVWIGLQGILNRPIVAGQFDSAVNHDCFGAVDSAEFAPYGTAFALYFTCDMTPATAPPLTFQWLSVVLPTNQGHNGAHQFAAGDYNNDGVDSIAIRRGPFIAYTNIAPTTLLAEYDLAQYWGTPSTTGGDYGLFLAGDFDLLAGDSFGVYYANGYFYYRQSVDWNPGAHVLQRIAPPTGTITRAVTWH